MLERTVFLQPEPPSLAQLIEQGVRLWHEEAERRPSNGLARLWDMAAARMSRQTTSARRDFGSKKRTKATPHEHSGFRAHHAELLILGDNLVPQDWDSTEPYPYQGLFISSFYFHESQTFLANLDTDAAWASLAKAYYYLGMNSSALTAHESSKMASKARHAKATKGLREIVVEILSSLQGDRSIKSGAQARERVIKAIEGNAKYRSVHARFDRMTKKKKDDDYPRTARDRLAALLLDWSDPRSGNPEIEKAFRPFKQKRRPRHLGHLG